MTTPNTESRTVSVPEAGRILGIGKNAAYAAAKRQEIPCLKIGSQYRVPIAALEKLLDKAG